MSGVVHDCGTVRGIGYALEPQLLLALFSGKMLPCHNKGCLEARINQNLQDRLHPFTCRLSCKF